MSTVLDAINYARANSNSDSNGISDANGLIWANSALLDIRREYIKYGVDAAQIQEAYRDTLSGQGTYVYPSDMFFLKSLELNYKNTSQQDYVTANQIDISDLSTSYDWLRVNQDSSAPVFDDHGDWYEIFPTPKTGDNTTSAIKLFYYLQPTEYTSVNSTLVYPDTLDYRIIGKRIQMYFMRSLEKFDIAKSLDDESREDIRGMCGLLSRGSEMPTTTQGIQWTGYEF